MPDVETLSSDAHPGRGRAGWGTGGGAWVQAWGWSMRRDQQSRSCVMRKSAEEITAWRENKWIGTIRGMAGLGRRDLTQIGKDNKRC